MVEHFIKFKDERLRETLQIVLYSISILTTIVVFAMLLWG